MKLDNESPVRILHITQVLSAAGIESFIMNNYRRIDRNKVQFDFFVLRNEKEFYDDEIKELGGIKYWIHAKKKNTLARVIDESFQLYHFLKEHRYNTIHIHYTTPLRAPYLLAAKIAGVKNRIYHAHSAYVSGKNLIKRVVYSLMRRGITKWGTHYFACSNAAADWIFEKKLINNRDIKVVYNGIDVERFKFDENIRKKIRKIYNLKDKYVLIHTGRFLEQKNHVFLIDMFEELNKKYPDSYLMLLGTGELIDSIKKRVHEKNLDSSICFLGVKSDVNKYLCAADCYVMPSLYEGLPVAAVEAECSGLPCVFSKNITQEVALTENIKFLSLDVKKEEWCNAIYSFKDINRNDTTGIIRNVGYDIVEVTRKLQEFYLRVN